MTQITVAFDTSTSSSSVALLVDGELRESRSDQVEGARPGHSSDLMPMLDGLLSEAGVSYGNIATVAVGLGPGTFTGIRIGISNAIGLSIATGAKLVGVSSLRALSAAALERSSSAVAMIDARRGEVFVSLARNGAPSTEAVAVPLAEVTGLIAPGDVCVGTGATMLRETLESCGAIVLDDSDPLNFVSAGRIALLAGDPDRSGREVLPIYVRAPDAVPVSER
jgi:tRNA threonylcarbamoyladenosine biosynthesis protein TsaB